MARLAIVAALAALLLAGCSSGPRAASAADAEYWCRDFVRDRLKAPGNASFAGYSASRIERLDANSFAVASWVDAENSFGAKIRTRYGCAVRYEPARDTWTLVSLEFE